MKERTVSNLADYTPPPLHTLYSVPYCMSPGGCPITDGECPLTCGLAAGGGKLHSCAVSVRGPLGSVGCGNE